MLKVRLAALDGRIYETDRVWKLECSDRLDTPAQSLTVSIPEPSRMGELVRISVFWGGECLFDGTVDEQEWRLGGSEDVLEISARSAGGALLDNEAIPVTYSCPCLEDLYQLHLKPYGVRGWRGSSARCSTYYPVRAGVSEWDAVRAFCIGVLGVLPRLTDDLMLDATGEPSGRGMLFSNTQTGAHRYTALTARRVRGGVIGEIAYQSGWEGTYACRARSVSAAARDITTRQVVNLSGTADWEKYSVLSRMFHASEQGSEELVLKTQEFFPCRPGDCVRVRDSRMGAFDGYVIYEIVRSLSGGEPVCRLVLRPERYLKGWNDHVVDTAAVIGEQRP